MRVTSLVVFAVLAFALVSPALSAECNPNDTSLLKPDLISLPPSRIKILNKYGHRILTFTSSIGNTGNGPLILHGHTLPGKACQGGTGIPGNPCSADADCPGGGTCEAADVTRADQEIWRTDGTACSRTAGYFVFHPTHKHFHFQDFSVYQLRKGDPITGEVIAEASKASFCLLDIERLPYTAFRNSLPQFTNDCLNPEGTYGISVGFADVYDFLLPEQAIDLDADPEHPVPPGDYYLVNAVNPDVTLWESDASLQSNSGFVSVTIGTRGSLHAHLPATVHQPRGPVMRPRSRFPHAPHPPHAPRPAHTSRTTSNNPQH